MIRATIAISAILLCLVLPELKMHWHQTDAPRFKLFLIGAFIAFAIVATVISSAGVGAEFVYVSF